MNPNTNIILTLTRHFCTTPKHVRLYRPCYYPTQTSYKHPKHRQHVNWHHHNYNCTCMVLTKGSISFHVARFSKSISWTNCKKFLNRLFSKRPIKPKMDIFIQLKINFFYLIPKLLSRLQEPYILCRPYKHNFLPRTWTQDISWPPCAEAVLPVVLEKPVA